MATTIAAIATPAGQGGIGIVRVSGPEAKNLLSRVFLPRSRHFENFIPWHLHHGIVLDSQDEALDDALAVFMPGPGTFTGEDVAEIHCHGSPVVLESLLENLLHLGATQATRGEFTRRAFVNGRMDLSQAEAVAELIAAPTRESLRYSLNRLEGLLGDKIRVLRQKLDELRALAFVGVDFPDDEIDAPEPEEFAGKTADVLADVRYLLRGAARCRSMMQGALVVIAGAVNAGKSSLLNAISGRERALVTPVPGTTRDFIEEHLDFDGLPVRLVDTAGLRMEEAAGNPGHVEALGIAKSMELVKQADLVLLVFDGARAADLSNEEISGYQHVLDVASGKVLCVWNKCDIAVPRQFPPAWIKNASGCVLSAATGKNLEQMCAMARELILEDAAAAGADDALAPNVRQAAALRTAEAELAAVLAEGVSDYDCCLTRLDTAAAALEDIVGLADHDELLDKIFANFCIGK